MIVFKHCLMRLFFQVSCIGYKNFIHCYVRSWSLRKSPLRCFNEMLWRLESWSQYKCKRTHTKRLRNYCRFYCGFQKMQRQRWNVSLKRWKLLTSIIFFFGLCILVRCKTFHRYFFRMVINFDLSRKRQWRIQGDHPGRGPPIGSTHNFFTYSLQFN